MAGLPLDPGSKARLQRSMVDLEGPRREGAPVLDRRRERTAFSDRDEHRNQFDANRLRARFLSRQRFSLHPLSPSPILPLQV
jgi:hypothetical protein